METEELELYYDEFFDIFFFMDLYYIINIICIFFSRIFLFISKMNSNYDNFF